MDDSLIIYFTRDSFCMGDDVIAPNIEWFRWYKNSSERTLFERILSYLSLNLPRFRWRGYAGGDRIADVVFSRGDEKKLDVKIILTDDWHEKLLRAKTVHFLHCMPDEDDLPETTDRCYTYKEAQELSEYAPSWVKKACEKRCSVDNKKS